MTTLSDQTSNTPNALQSSLLQPLLEISDLCIDVAHNQHTTRIVDRVSLTIPKGKTVALLGESGSGKSLTAMSILRLLPYPTVRIASGNIRFASEPRAQATGWSTNPSRAGSEAATQSPSSLSEPPAQAGVTNRVARSSSSLAVANDNHESLDLTTLPDNQLRHIRGRRIAMIFQEPMTALNPVYPVGQQIVDVLQAHNKMSNRDAWNSAIDWLKQVGLPAPERRAREYPHQLSGGMRQRVLIAMALCCYPKLLIADEPTTALDATVQMQILDLLRDLQRRHGMSILFITHDLGVVAEMADYAYVMYAGRIVESAPTRDLLTRPLHPYTQGLLRCVPTLGTTNGNGNAQGVARSSSSLAVESVVGAANPDVSEPSARAEPGASIDVRTSEPRAQATGHPSPLTKGGQKGGLSTTSTPFVPSCLGGSSLGGSSIVLPTIPGTVPEPSRYPTGCRFHTRCQLSFDLAQHPDSDSVPLENAAYPRALRRCTEQQPTLSSPSPSWGEGRGEGLRHQGESTTDIGEGLPLVRESLLAPPPDGIPSAPKHFVACWEAIGTHESGTAIA